MAYPYVKNARIELVGNENRSKVFFKKIDLYTFKPFFVQPVVIMSVQSVVELSELMLALNRCFNGTKLKMFLLT